MTVDMNVSKRVLIADDSAFMRKLISEIISSHLIPPLKWSVRQETDKKQ